MADIPRSSDVVRRRKMRQAAWGAVGLTAIALITVGVSRLQPAAPSVDGATVWIETVKRGSMVRQVRGTGSLIPEEIRWIPALTEGRVERILVRPGPAVEIDTIILELSSDLLNQQASAARVEAELEQATLQSEADQELALQGLVSSLTVKISQSRADELKTRNGLIAGRVTRIDPAVLDRSVTARDPDGAEAGQSFEVTVRNRNPVVVSDLPPRTLLPGQTVTVDVALESELPRGARPDLTVDGTIELERLEDVIYVGRPAFGQENSMVSLFWLVDSGAAAQRIRVALGRSSVNTIEITEGLRPEDRVIVSDMSAWDAFDRVRLNQP